MKILCRKIISPTGKDLGASSPWLNVDEEYIILAMTLVEGSGLQVYIQTEHYNEPHFSSVIGFEFLSQKIPTSWITVLSEAYGRKVITMLPASWNYDSFFEDVDDEKAEAVALFSKEAELIYQEENQA